MALREVALGEVALGEVAPEPCFEGDWTAILLFLTCGRLMNNHENISLAVRACGLHGCYKPGAEVLLLL